MKRSLIGTLSLVGMSLLLNVNGADAQSAVHANVPFAFNVGTSQLPAGSYNITFEDATGMVMIRNSRTGVAALSLGPTRLSWRQKLETRVSATWERVLPDRDLRSPGQCRRKAPSPQTRDKA